MSLSDKEKERYERKTDDIKELKEWEAPTVEYWKERMKRYPDAVSAELQGVIEGMKDRRDEFKASHKRMARDHQYNNKDEAAELQEMIDRYDAVIEKLETIIGSNKTNEVKPVDKKDWIRQEYNQNKDKFKNDSEWAKATATKFKNHFNTSIGDDVSMKRYGIYDGLN